MGWTLYYNVVRQIQRFAHTFSKCRFFLSWCFWAVFIFIVICLHFGNWKKYRMTGRVCKSRVGADECALMQFHQVIAKPKNRWLRHKYFSRIYSHGLRFVVCHCSFVTIESTHILPYIQPKFLQKKSIIRLYLRNSNLVFHDVRINN